VKVRVWYREESGELAEVETRPDESFDEEEQPPEQGLASIVVDSDDLEGYALSELHVEDGKLRKPRGRRRNEEEERHERIEELRQMGKSGLSDEEWLALYREYVTLTRQF
jgi:hypothetical protein